MSKTCPLTYQEIDKAKLLGRTEFAKLDYHEAIKIVGVESDWEDEAIACAAYRKALEECAELANSYPLRIAKWNDQNVPNRTDVSICADVEMEIRAKIAEMAAKPAPSPSRAEIEAAIRSAWNHFGSLEHTIRKLFGETP